MIMSPIFICIDKKAGHFKAWFGQIISSQSGRGEVETRWGAIGTPICNMQSSVNPASSADPFAFLGRKQNEKVAKGYVQIPESIYRMFFPDNYANFGGNERRGLFTSYMGILPSSGLDEHEYEEVIEQTMGENGESCRDALSRLNIGFVKPTSAQVSVAPPPLPGRLSAGFPGNEVGEAIRAADVLGVRDLILGWTEGNGAWIGVPGGDGRIIVASWCRGGMPGEVDDLLDVGEVAGALGRLPADGQGCIVVDVTEDSISVGTRIERSLDRIEEQEEAITP
jgi:hypothetical protein